jgi:hypothetical protein
MGPEEHSEVLAQSLTLLPRRTVREGLFLQAGRGVVAQVRG